jgi:hypothetical protein
MMSSTTNEEQRPVFIHGGTVVNDDLYVPQL